jgi:hypothetical protein
MKTIRCSLGIKQILLSMFLICAALGQSQDSPDFAAGLIQPDSKLMLLIRNDVSDDLNLSPSQKDRIAGEVKKMLPNRGGGMPGGGMPGGGMPGGGMPGGGMMRDMIRGRIKDTENRIVKLLSESQSARLIQIQQQVKGPVYFFDKKVQKRLKLTKDQVKQIQAAERTYKKQVEETIKRMRSGASTRQKGANEIEGSRAEAGAVIDAILNADQKELRDADLGRTFVEDLTLGNFVDLPIPGGR